MKTKYVQIASDKTPSQVVVAETARSVLSQSLRATHYSKLAVAALDRMEWPHRGDPVVVGRVAEGLRQDAARWTSGLRYGGLKKAQPAVVFLHEWFDKQPTLVNSCSAIEVKMSDATKGLALQWVESRNVKNKHGLPEGDFARRLARTIAVEKCVVYDFFAARWPSLVIGPSNETDPSRPAPDDCSFALKSGRVTVDVATPNQGGRRRGVFGGFPKDAAIDIHVLALPGYSNGRLAKATIVGWCLPDAFAAGVRRGDAFDLRRIIATLNAEADGLDVEWLRRATTLTFAQRLSLVGSQRGRSKKRDQGSLF